MIAARDVLLRWTATGALPRERLPGALRIAGVVPSPAQWTTFLARACTWIGVALLAAAAMCFIAANWQALGRFAKFALVEGAIVAALAVAAWRGLDTLAGRAALFACAVLMGVLLALVGQVYQTGADTYELFCAWAVAIAVWVVLGRQPALWLLWIALARRRGAAVLPHQRGARLRCPRIPVRAARGWWLAFAHRLRSRSPRGRWRPRAVAAGRRSAWRRASWRPPRARSSRTVRRATTS